MTKPFETITQEMIEQIEENNKQIRLYTILTTTFVLSFLVGFLIFTLL